MRPYLWVLGGLTLVAALAASGCTSSPPANLTPSARATARPCVACMVNVTSNPLTHLPVDEQRLVAFVNEAAAYPGANGEIRALEAFNYPDGSFVKDEPHVFA